MRTEAGALEKYKNLSGKSGVAQYHSGDGSIRIMFLDGAIYEYTNASAGADNIIKMQGLAVAGRGLSSFISTTVREAYSRRIR